MDPLYELTDEEKIERDIEALAQLIFDIYMDKKQRERTEIALNDE